MFAWATVAEATTAAEIADALALCRPGLVAPLPELEAARLDELAAGQVVRLLHHADPEQPSTAVGVAVLEGSLASLWVAAQDPHAVVDPSLHEFVVRSLGPDEALWYGHMDLPRPLKDRQWVVRSTNTHALARATGGRCWEHTWALQPDELPVAREAVAGGLHPAITLAMVDDAVFTPVNHGSWMFARLDDQRAVVAYQATTVVGGAIPDWLVAELARARLEEVMRSLEQRAGTWARGHYVAGHAPLIGADGAPLSPFPE